MRYTLTWLHNAPSPNQMEFFQELAKQPGVRLRVLHCSAVFNTRPFSLGDPWLQGSSLAFEHHILRGSNLRWGKYRELYINPEVLQEVFRSSPNEVWLVGGHTIPTMQMAMWALDVCNRPWVLVSEPPKIRNWLRDEIRDLLLLPGRLGARGVIAYGSPQKAAYFSRLFPPEKIFVTPQYQNLAPLRSTCRSLEAGSNGSRRPLCYFYAGQIEQYSGVDLVVRAFNRVAAKHPDVRLEVLGTGSLRPYVEGLVAESARPRVHFHGAIPRDKVPEVFSRGDVLVHANLGQGWGMAVNEGFAAGMPVIASRAVGAAESLVVSGVNGFLLDSPRDEEGFFQSMKFFADHRDRLPEFIENAWNTADSIRLDRGVAEFLAILDRLLGRT
jgi:glycosyltransferase involved in cell wall biosynthesis